MRTVALRPNGCVKPCPKCGNSATFDAISHRVAEDLCEVWVRCRCGFDPTRDKPGARMESVMGGTSPENVRVAIDVWNDLLSAVTND